MRPFMLGVCVALIWWQCLGQNSGHNSAPLDQEGPSDSPIIRALSNGDLKAARDLLDQGVPVNSHDRFGITLLGAAVMFNRPSFVEALIAKGADVNLSADERGSSPLMSASFGCEREIVRLLLDHGANTKFVDRDGETPLSYAAEGCKDGEVTKLLIAFGAELNVKNKLGNTPLMEAAYNGNIAATQKLVEAGANAEIKNKKGETAETKACFRNIGSTNDHKEICAFLRHLDK